MEEEADDGDDVDMAGATTITDATKKKKKKSGAERKKKAAEAALATSSLDINAAVTPVVLQTNPPTIPVNDQFRNRAFPPGEICEYVGENAYRTSSAELRAREMLDVSTLQDMREAAEVHRQVRKYAKEHLIKPGAKLIDICEQLEDMTRKLIRERGLEAGPGFPTGVSINHVAAHYTPNPADTNVVLNYDDVMKVDFGTQINGRIIDCAWTVHFNPKYDNLVAAVADATNTG